jgi:hypothetical protein
MSGRHPDVYAHRSHVRMWKNSPALGNQTKEKARFTACGAANFVVQGSCVLGIPMCLVKLGSGSIAAMREHMRRMMG